MRTPTTWIRLVAGAGLVLSLVAAAPAPAYAEPAATGPAVVRANDQAAFTEATSTLVQAKNSAAAEQYRNFGDDYWLLSHITPQYTSGVAFTSAHLGRKRIRFYGSAYYARDEQTLFSDNGKWRIKDMNWKYKVNKKTVYEGYNAFGPNERYTRKQAKRMLESLNGLGVELHVKNGVVTYLCFRS